MHLKAGLLLSLLADAALARTVVGANQKPNVNRAAVPYAVKEPPLTTDWTYKVGTNPWPEYPRPQLERAEWQNLNGIWKYQDAGSLDALKTPPFGQELSHEVLIPSCLESGLSGILGSNTLYSWFSTSFNIPSDWSGQQLLLNFGAVDYEATVFVNGKQAGFNRGGYARFTVDVTEFVSHGGENELYVIIYFRAKVVATNASEMKTGSFLCTTQLIVTVS